MSDPVARFAELVRRPEPDIPLDEAALLIAAAAHPGLDVASQMARLDELAAGCDGDTLDALRHHLFHQLGFAGNTTHYGDPRNCLLDDVLERRRGMPITLSIVVLEVGRRLRLPVVGVGMPGHFLVKHEAVPVVLIDAFHRGRLLDHDGAARLLQAMFGDDVSFEPSMLAPVGARAILTRVLANLRQIYAASGDAVAQGWVLRLRVAIPADDPRQLGDLADAQASLGRLGDAAVTMERLADELQGDASQRARRRARQLRNRLS